MRSSIYSAGIAKDPYAKWFVEKIEDWIYSFEELLLLDPDVNAKSPETLPKGKLFRNAGTVISRDGWGEESTQFIFYGLVITNIHK
jgi:hypothetical protein